MNERDRAEEQQSAYMLRYLAGHLAAAGRWEELHTLVAEGATERLDWAEARHGLDGSYAGFISDLILAWMHAEEEGSKEPAMIGRLVRYALIKSSVHALAQKMPVKLLEALIIEHVPGWTPAAALAYIEQIPDVKRRGEVLGGLAHLLTPELTDRAWQIALAISDEDARSGAIGALVSHLPSERLTDAWNGILTLQTENSFLTALTTLAPRLTANLGYRILTHIRSRGTGICGILRVMIPHLPQPVLSDAIQMLRQIDDPLERCLLVADLAPYMPEDLLAEAVTALPHVREEQVRSVCIMKLAQHLPRPLLRQAFAVACMIKNSSTLRETILGMAPYLSAESLIEALRVARTVDNEYERSLFIGGLARHLPEECRLECLSAAEAVSDPGCRALALASIALSLPPDHVALSEVQALIHRMKGNLWAARAAIVLASRCSPTDHDLLTDALEGVYHLLDNIAWDAHEQLRHLAPHLPPDLLAKAVSRIGTMRSGYFDVRTIENIRAEALGTLGPYLSRELAESAFTFVKRCHDERDRVLALIGLGPYLPSELLPETLGIVLGFLEDSTGFGVQALRILAPRLSIDLLQQALSSVVLMEYRWGDERQRTHALDCLIPHLPDELLLRVANEILRIGDEKNRIEIIVQLAPQLSSCLVQRTLETVRHFERDQERAQALEILAPILPNKLHADALAITNTITDDIWRAHALHFIAPYLSAELSAEGLKMIKTISKGSAQAQALTALAPCLADSSKREAFAAAAAMKGGYYRSRAESGVIRWLPIEMLAEAIEIAHRNEQKDRLLPDSLDDAGANRDEGYFYRHEGLEAEEAAADALTRLAPNIVAGQINVALAAVARMNNEGTRARALAALSVYSKPDLQSRANTIANAVIDEGHQGAAPNGSFPDLASTAKQYPHAITAILDQAEGYQYRIEELRLLGTHRRQELLANLTNLIPVMISLGGPTTATEIARAILDVGTWWP